MSIESPAWRTSSSASEYPPPSSAMVVRTAARFEAHFCSLTSASPWTFTMRVTFAYGAVPGAAAQPGRAEAGPLGRSRCEVLDQHVGAGDEGGEHRPAVALLMSSSMLSFPRLSHTK